MLTNTMLVQKIPEYSVLKGLHFEYGKLFCFLSILFSYVNHNISHVRGKLPLFSRKPTFPENESFIPLFP